MIAQAKESAQRIVNRETAAGAIVVSRRGIYPFNLYMDGKIEERYFYKNPIISARMDISQKYDGQTAYWVRIKAIERRWKNVIFQIVPDEVRQAFRLQLGHPNSEWPQYSDLDDEATGTISFDLVQGDVRLGQEYFLKFVGHLATDRQKLVGTEIMCPFWCEAENHPTLVSVSEVEGSGIRRAEVDTLVSIRDHIEATDPTPEIATLF